VKDEAAWKAWVKQHRAEIVAHAREGRENALYSKVVGVYRLSSGRVVASAFEAVGLTLPSDLPEELEGRNTVLHQGMMAPEGYDVPRDLTRVALVRTMLVALLAKTVGYGGAINGWEVGGMGYPVEPDAWWKVDEEQKRLAQRVYVAEHVDDAAEREHEQEP
jgi:hypothetical protein